MAEMMDIFDDAPSGKNSNSSGVKKLFKNKKFLAACAVVAVVALFVAWKRNKETSYFDGSQAIGYAGYPTTGGGGGDTGGTSDTSYLDDYNATIEEIQKEYNSSLDSVTKEYDSTLDSMYSNINDLSDQIYTLQEANEAQALKAQRDLDLGQMKANSTLYHYTNDKATQEALHKQNAAIAAKYGWDYDEQSGQYFENGVPVYGRADLGPLPTTQTVAPKVPTSSATWEKNVDYQKKINEAILSGASGSQIDAINAQRDAKIRATGAKDVNSQFDKDTDYKALIDKAKASGASQSVIDNLSQQRQAKINTMYAGVDPDSKPSRSSSRSSSSSSSSRSSSSSSSRSSNSSSSSRSSSSSSGSSAAEKRAASLAASTARAAERAAHGITSSFKFRR